MKRLLNVHEAPIIVFTILVILLFTIISPDFFQLDNFKLILDQNISTFIVAIGMTMVILLGGMDLSVGSVLAVTATSIQHFPQSWHPSVDCGVHGDHHRGPMRDGQRLFYSRKEDPGHNRESGHHVYLQGNCGRHQRRGLDDQLSGGLPLLRTRQAARHFFSIVDRHCSDCQLRLSA